MSDPGQPPPGGWEPIRRDPVPDDLPPPFVPPAPPPLPPPLPTPGPVPGPAAPTPATPPVGGRGAAGRAPKRIRPASVGRRPPSIALAGGLGLLGLLLTIGILAVLSTRSVSGTDDATDLLEGRLPAELTTTTADPTTADPTTAPGAPLDPAAAVVCEANRDVLETAVRAHELTNGAPPPDQQVLVAAGLLEEPVTTHELVAGPGGATVAGIGECAGR